MALTVVGPFVLVAGLWDDWCPGQTETLDSRWEMSRGRECGGYTQPLPRHLQADPGLITGHAEAGRKTSYIVIGSAMTITGLALAKGWLRLPVHIEADSKGASISRTISW